MERESSRRRIEELERQLQETHLQRVGSTTAAGVDTAELKSLPLSRLEGLRQQLRRDLDRLDSSIQQRKGALCLKCQEFPRCVLTQPCQHCVLCEKCAESMDEAHRVCPYCQERITHCSTALIPL
ncbi:Putative E3 ubiquitin-protein ligase UNKL [Geodia barretti]|nr:Putative E3 ubiquitin-protein ligase UNKL [Geodia barretti]